MICSRRRICRCISTIHVSNSYFFPSLPPSLPFSFLTLGGGVGSLRWRDVRQFIDDMFTETNLPLYIYNLRK